MDFTNHNTYAMMMISVQFYPDRFMTLQPLQQVLVPMGTIASIVCCVRKHDHIPSIQHLYHYHPGNVAAVVIASLWHVDRSEGSSWS